MFKLVVLFSVLAFAAAKPSLVLPLAYSGYPAVSSQSQYSVHGSAIVPAYTADYGLTYPSAGYPVAAWAQPAYSPAVVLDPINGVPLDTPEVVAARAAHFQAKALAGHHLAKRSLTYSSVVPSYAYSPYSSGVVAPLGYSSLSSPLAYSSLSSPLASSYSPYVTPYGHYAVGGVVPKALSVHPY